MYASKIGQTTIFRGRAKRTLGSRIQNSYKKCPILKLKILNSAFYFELGPLFDKEPKYFGPVFGRFCEHPGSELTFRVECH